MYYVAKNQWFLCRHRVACSTKDTQLSERPRQRCHCRNQGCDLITKNSGFPLIQCEFPPLESLNKLGDGSLRSANEVEQANLKFCSKLLGSLSPIPFGGPTTFLKTGKSSVRGNFCSLLDGIPSIKANCVCVLLSPSSRSDYQAAETLASDGKPVLSVNGFAKDQKSVSVKATMTYFLKPLTYKSQIAGYLIRCYPGKWTTIDAVSKQILGSFDDDEILVGNSNTPDLRESGRLVQKSVYTRAIHARLG